MATYELNVNGMTEKVDAAPDMPLLWAIRDMLGYTGTKFGCGIGACSACAVLVDGKQQQSCQLTCADVVGKKVVTIEGVDHPVQKAWDDFDVPQCGYCQAGQVIAAVSLLNSNPNPDDAAIDAAFKGHVCRCGTYPRIRAAVKAAGGSK